MTNNNLYIAVEANTKGENEVTSFAFGEITSQDLRAIPDGLDYIEH